MSEKHNLNNNVFKFSVKQAVDGMDWMLGACRETSWYLISKASILIVHVTIISPVLVSITNYIVLSYLVQSLHYVTVDKLGMLNLNSFFP